MTEQKNYDLIECAVASAMQIYSGAMDDEAFVNSLCRRAVEAYLLQLTDSGFVIVPEQPTEQMIIACYDEIVFEDDGLSIDEIRNQPVVCWRAMISAAPKSTARSEPEARIARHTDC